MPKTSIKFVILQWFTHVGWISPSFWHVCGRFFNNAYYAKVGGVSTSELNRLEVKFLFGINFRLYVSVDTFRAYCMQLEKGASSEGLPVERPIRTCRLKEDWSTTAADDARCASPVARWRDSATVLQQWNKNCLHSERHRVYSYQTSIDHLQDSHIWSAAG